jgi:hypothetical protein
MANAYGYTSKKTGKTVNVGSLKLVLDEAQKKLSEALEGRSQAAVNAIIRVALNDAGQMWIKVFLPKRFTEYATSVLGYRTTEAYTREKVLAAEQGRPLNFRSERSIFGDDINSGVVLSPQPTPFVASGRSRDLCLSSARVDVRVTSSGGRIQIRCQVGVIKMIQQYQSFTSIPAVERQRVIDQVRRNLANMLGQTGPGKPFDKDFRWTSESSRKLPPQDERSAG